MKKVIILNASPRTNFNTAKMLKEAQKGAESVGAEVEYFDLVKLNYKGCMSCFACKIKNSKTNGLCAIRDDLRPILEKIYQADAVIVGTPVYFASANATLIAFLTRLFYSTRFDKTMKVGAGIAVARRSGITTTYDEINNFFAISTSNS